MTVIIGRPTSYTPDLATALCDRLATGESLRTICSDPAMPDKSTVFRWLADAGRTDFRDQYARAREAQAEWLAEEIIEIADETSGDYVQKRSGEDVVEVVDHEHIQRSKLRVDARKWFASKVAPKRYGDRVAMDHAGTVTIADPIDRPPRETYEQWAERRSREAGAATVVAPNRAAD